MFSTSFWIIFIIFILLMLIIDLGLFSKSSKAPTLTKATLLSLFWISLATVFCGVIYIYVGSQKAIEFATGYIVELSLSVDNIFIFILLFKYFKVDFRYQHRVLFWGVIGAIVMRFIMITGGIALVDKFEWIFYIFGGFLIFTAYKIMFTHNDEVELKDNRMLHFLRKYLNFTDQYHSDKFIVKLNGKNFFTPLFLVLILVEQTDLIFAMDSIPAIIAITRDPFIVFTSNIFAILGLRSFYFMLANIVHKFIYLKYGLGVILGFIGIKMTLTVIGFHIPISISLSIIVISLFVSIMASLIVTNKKS